MLSAKMEMMQAEQMPPPGVGSTAFEAAVASNVAMLQVVSMALEEGSD